jgi:hypothetical protein
MDNNILITYRKEVNLWEANLADLPVKEGSQIAFVITSEGSSNKPFFAEYLQKEWWIENGASILYNLEEIASELACYLVKNGIVANIQLEIHNSMIHLINVKTFYAADDSFNLAIGKPKTEEK